MKYRVIFINQLKNLPYFSTEMVRSLGKQYTLKARTVDSYISRSLASKEIIALKNGTYVTADFYNRNAGEISYTFYLANVLRAPSYVSSWSALQYYNLATEGIGTVTSVTTKVTRTYNNQAGSFAYNHIKKECFSECNLVKGKFDFFIASPAKALFDLLYFKTVQLRGIHFKDLNELVDSLRVDIDGMEENERKTFHALIKKFLKSI